MWVRVIASFAGAGLGFLVWREGKDVSGGLLTDLF